MILSTSARDTVSEADSASGRTSSFLSKAGKIGVNKGGHGGSPELSGQAANLGGSVNSGSQKTGGKQKRKTSGINP